MNFSIMKVQQSLIFWGIWLGFRLWGPAVSKENLRRICLTFGAYNFEQKPDALPQS
jgi:hypothetical protein